MTTASAEILARKAKYDRIERETDAAGRVIGVKRLSPSKQITVQEMAPALDGYTTTVLPSGDVINVPKSAPLIMAAAVCEIDGVAIPFPTTRGQLNAILDRLDDEGLAAVAVALSKFQTAENAPPIEDAAKN